MNDYDKLASSYGESNSKPDKKYSILPTVMKMAGHVDGKIVLDLGCGDGFFAKVFMEKGAEVTGIDNSNEQLKSAHLNNPELKLFLADIFKDELPAADIICAPFVLNYADSPSALKKFLKSIFDSLTCGGKVIFVIDLPNGKNLKRFGAVKILSNMSTDGSKLKIQLYNNEKLICALDAFYYKKKTIESYLKGIGFSRIKWHKPIVDESAFETIDQKSWKKYLEEPELGYLTATKNCHRI